VAAEFREHEGQLVRWLEQLQEYDFNIVHRVGGKHLNADAMSRRSSEQDQPTGQTTVKQDHQPIAVAQSTDEEAVG